MMTSSAINDPPGVLARLMQRRLACFGFALIVLVVFIFYFTPLFLTKPRNLL